MHGGDIYTNTIAYDFSVNTNPLGMPNEVKAFLKSDLAISFAQVYPEIESVQLCQMLAKKWDIPREQFVCGNGVSELLDSFFRMKEVGKVLLSYPCFTEYEKIARQYGHQIIGYETREENDFTIGEEILELIEQKKPEIIMLCNPGNPVGNLISPAILSEIVALAKTNHLTLAIDECFLPFVSNEQGSVLKRFYNEFEDGTCIVFRGFTKIYAMAGLRIGYAVTSDIELAKKMRKNLPTWNVSSIAQQSAMIALSCDAYLKETRLFLAAWRAEMVQALSALGIETVPGSANYILFKARVGLKEALLKKQILIRQCDDYKGILEDADQMYYRVSVKAPKTQEVLIKALEEVL